MKTHVLISNKEKYNYEFSDSHYAFAEDLEDTISSYCSIREIEYSNIQSLLFTIHSHVSKLRFDDGIDEDLIKKFGLEGYGNGPQYEDEEIYFILNGDYRLNQIRDTFVSLTSENDMILLNICKHDIDLLLNDNIEAFEEGDSLSFDGMESFIFINEKKTSIVLKNLHLEINKLNNLLSELKKDESIVRITKSIL